MVEHEDYLLETLQPFDRLCNRLGCSLRTVGYTDNRPLVLLHLRHGHRVDLSLGDDDLLTTVTPEVLPEQAHRFLVTKHSEALLRVTNFLCNLAVTLIACNMHCLTMRRLTDCVAEVLASFLADATLDQCLVLKVSDHRLIAASRGSCALWCALPRLTFAVSARKTVSSTVSVSHKVIA